jgi:penicillin-binding protein 1A
MATEGFITPHEAAVAKDEPLGLAPKRPEQVPAAYFVEDVRRILMDRFGDEMLYRGGLRVHTTLDPVLQTYAEEALVAHVVDWDRVRGFRGIDRNVFSEGLLPEKFDDPTWRLPIRAGTAVNALVIAVDRRGAELKIGEWSARADGASAEWTGMRPDEIFRRGDVARFRVRGMDPGARTVEVEFEQVPRLQGALVALDVASGAVKALVGGYDYALSEFDRATQAYRQTGSAFKPIYYSAALENGWNPGSELVDEPKLFLFPITKQIYSPKNYYPTFDGLVTIRTSIEKSLNTPSVQLLNDLGYRTAIAYASNMGLREEALAPYPSLALGVADLTLLELTSAYTTFPNGGVHAQPYFIERVEDRNGSVIDAHESRTTVALRPETAFQMTYLLMGVVENGTGKKARRLGRPLAGKTGTTDDYTDAWFVGFTPGLAVGTWVGYDEKKPLGKHQTGAEAALPMWIRFMERALEGTPVEKFRKPSSIVFLPVDRRTGKPAGPNCPEESLFTEAFPANDLPQAECGPADHLRLRLPGCLQRFELDSNLQLVVDYEQQLLMLDGAGCGVRVDPGQRLVEVYVDGAEKLIGYRVRPIEEVPFPGPDFLPEGFASGGLPVHPVRIGPWAPPDAGG